MKKIFLLTVLLAAAVSVYGQGFIVERYSYAGPYQVRMPVMVDSLDVNGKPFADDGLLDNRFFPEDIFTTGRELTAGADGELRLPASPDGKSLHYLAFNLNSSGYASGTLNLTMPAGARIYMDGRQQKPSGGKLKLTLYPRNYEFTVKYLADSDSAGVFSAVFEGEDATSLSQQRPGRKRYSIYDVMQGVRIRSASVSPDGRYALINYSENPGGGQRSRSYCELVEIASGRTVMSEDATKGYAWMPRSPKLYYIRQSMGSRELVTVDPATLQEQVVARNLPEGSLRMAPTEDYMIYSKKEQGPAEKDKSVKQVLDPTDRQAGARDRWSVWRYDLLTGMDERLTFGHTNVGVQSISQDGGRLLFSTSDGFIPERPFRESSYYVLDLQTMQVDTLFTGARFINNVLFSPDGRRLMVLGSAEAFGGLGLNLPEGMQANYYDMQLYLCDGDRGNPRTMTRDFDPSVEAAMWSRHDNRIYFSATDRDFKKVFMLDPGSGRITEVPTEVDVVSTFTVASGAPALVYYGQSVSRSHQLYCVDLRRGSSRLLADPSARTLRDIDLGEVRDWNFTASDGTEIHGRMTLPPDFDPARKYPLIVYYYGGTTPSSRTLESNYPAHVYAGLGFVVYTVQPSGTVGFGQEFSARHVNAWGKRTADDIIEGTQKFCDAHGFVDREKIGCIGASYGGFMTMYLQTVTDIFAAAVSHAGISDITSYWGEGYWGYSYSGAASAGSYPWNNPGLYTGQSPLFAADKINTPLLLLHGTVDTNVPPGESIQMFTALKLLGKEVALVEVEGENHHIADPAKRVAWNNTIYAWFYKWLKDDPRWWDELYPQKNL